MNQDDYIQNKIYIINHIKDKFIFLKSNIETIDIIYKITYHIHCRVLYTIVVNVIHNIT